jgi:hypothetical protein
MTTEYNDIITTLSSFFKFDASAMLMELSNYGVIAGGSIVHALLPNEKTLPSDIDLFILHKGPFDEHKRNAIRDDIRNIIQKYAVIRGCEDGVHFVVNIHLKKGKIPIQIIIADDETFEELIDNFDMDYCQAGIYKGKLYQTTKCALAIETGVCMEASYHMERTLKAVQKGFVVPYNFSLTHQAKEMVPKKAIIALIDYDTAFETLEPHQYLKDNSSEQNMEIVNHSIVNSVSTQFGDGKRGIHIQMITAFDKVSKHGSEKDFRPASSIPVLLTILDIVDGKVHHEKQLGNFHHTHFTFHLDGNFEMKEAWFNTEQMYAVELVRLDHPHVEYVGIIKNKMENVFWLPPHTFEGDLYKKIEDELRLDFEGRKKQVVKQIEALKLHIASLEKEIEKI